MYNEVNKSDIKPHRLDAMFVREQHKILESFFMNKTLTVDAKFSIISVQTSDQRQYISVNTEVVAHSITI